MVMRKALAVSVMAAIVSVSAVGAASAASAKPAAMAAQVQSATFKVNGSDATIRFVASKGETLVSVRDLSKALEAKLSTSNGTTVVSLNGHTVQFKPNGKQLVADGQSKSLLQPVKSVNGTSYIALRPFIAGLGGTLSIQAGAISVTTVKLLEGAENPRFAGNGKLLVSKTEDNGRTDYLVDAKTGKYETLLSSSDASDLVVAPNGAKAAYTDSNGAVYVIDLASKVSSKVSDDSNIKPELVWSSDSSAIFFLQGDKGSVIAKLDPASGTITKVLDDKVDYKSSLSVSPDGTKFIYVVTTLGTVTSDATNVDEDNVSIDYSANQSQIYAFDASVKDGKPAKLTATTDDKVFVESADGVKAYYVSVPSEDQDSPLLAVDGSSTPATVYADSDVIESVLDGGKLYVLAAKNDASNVIYQIDLSTGAKKQLYEVSSEVSSIAVSGSQIAVVKDGQVLVLQGSSWKNVTK